LGEDPGNEGEEAAMDAGEIAKGSRGAQRKGKGQTTHQPVKVRHLNEQERNGEGTKMKKHFTVKQDFIRRCTTARSEETGEIKVIKSSGYLGNDLSIRKAIAIAFGLSSSRVIEIDRQ
jgi:hypothetical protein